MCVCVCVLWIKDSEKHSWECRYGYEVRSANVAHQIIHQVTWNRFANNNRKWYLILMTMLKGFFRHKVFCMKICENVRNNMCWHAFTYDWLSIDFYFNGFIEPKLLPHSFIYQSKNAKTFNGILTSLGCLCSIQMCLCTALYMWQWW